MDWNAGREDDPDKAIQYKKKSVEEKPGLSKLDHNDWQFFDSSLFSLSFFSP